MDTKFDVLLGQAIADGINAEPIPEITNAVRELVRAATENSPKLYSLEEIADLICKSYGECCETTCPGFDYCRQGKNGVLTWLEKLEKGDLQGR